MGWTGPAAAPRVRIPATTTHCGMLMSYPSAIPSIPRVDIVTRKHASVAALNCFVLSTYPPKSIPPTIIATWKPAPISSTTSSRVNPALCMVSEVKADTTFVTPIEATNAASGARNPGVLRSFQAVAGNVNHSYGSPSASRCVCASASFTAWAAEEVGGVGGRSRSRATVAIKAPIEPSVISERYSSSASGTCPLRSAPPTRNAAAMPSWLALRQTAVERARSSFPNHVADSSGGEHWKNGWAAPMSIVPTVSHW
mmetsp:Transcript_7699/g.18643  ORF Transcript_7699/g.18643 Transcript_7699/m.18643 type:complete len:255 (+) Transcript_7699:523-1287(+)